MNEHQHDEHQDHEHQLTERLFDVAVVGGSAAGLAAALQLVRQRRSVVVIDGGEPRNAPATHMHGYLGHEGVPPAEFTKLGREEVRSYGGEILSGRAIDVTRTQEDDLRVELPGGSTLRARRVLAATGLVDDLPDIEGLAEHWGGDVIHCPFCHGFEVRDQRIVQIVTHPMGLHPAALFSRLSDHLTLILHDGVGADNPEVSAMRSTGVNVMEGQVRRIVTGADGHIAGVELADGSSVDADVVVVSSRFRVRAEPFASLGLKPAEHPSGLGDYVETDETGETVVPGLYAAGNVTDPGQQVLHAAAHGSRVGAMIASRLAHEEIEAASRPSPVETHWDSRYGDDQIWSGNPNGTLVHELQDLPPGRALDVGAGEGGDAIWLARQGWNVMASDISRNALYRISDAADQNDLEVDCIQRDASELDAYESEAFDLVSAQYVPIPRSPDGRGVHNLLRAVAPGGVLLFVGHDLEPLRVPSTDQEDSPMIDPDAYLRAEDFATVLESLPGWEIEVHEKRARPGGATSSHVDDIVLRARRRPIAVN